MSFRKLKPEVIEALHQSGISEISEFGEKLFKGIKSGHPIFAIAPNKSGKTQAVIVACFNKINQAYEGAPRILFVTSSVEESSRIYETMSKVSSSLDVTVDLVHEKGDQVKQRNDIFNGTEIIVGTVKRIFDLYVQNGINIQLLDYLIFDDLELLLAQGKKMEIMRLIDGVQKTQIICLANENSTRVKQFLELESIPFRMIDLK